ncbi:Gfo/Idh/MocA family oxidoreductase [Chitinophaga nivalis]|uniref:Gfo/Idh/MocA family oxidoreductase n=1 Tax=Chitinophaga nivalis TaxID=2991709 RepID=A0ABT3IWS1_9BACT|nr:Gfo/Idh/MocA family oxidoreductase [Chitinophaga nivalis]MCW3461883.1 Gfo/Idh/MocA family oxidoreductase [Chitinophaga nivalis]MCW3488426.1 Gfo/Idh/MocA family oxidoreductase [Chitinophaga nivalis]
MSKVIKTGLCSYGMSGQVFHAPFLHVNPGFAFAAVVERSKHLAQQRYPNVQVYTSVEEMLADTSLELIVVNTPNYTHFEYVKAALEAGKHVIVEKPFTVTAQEGETLAALAAEKGLLLSVYHNRRYDNDYKIVKQVLQSGVLGDVLEVEIHYDRFKEELSYKKHKEGGLPGTGALYDLGSHLLDQAITLFGMPPALWADIRIIRKDSVVDDYFEIVLCYDQLRVRVKCNYLVREPLPAYQLHGRKGSFIKSKSDIQEAQLQRGLFPDSPDWGAEAPHEWGLLHTETDGKTVKQYLPGTNGNYMDYYQGIYAALVNKAANPVPPEDAIKVIRVIEAAFQSSREGKVIHL